MTTRQSPTLRRRRLSALLRHYRSQHFPTIAEVEKRLGWPNAKLSKMERGDWLRPNLRDMADLLDLYRVTDARQREEVLILAKQGRERGWWHPYREMLAQQYTTYIGLEAEAGGLLWYEPWMIHGLLQTAEYARHVIRSGPGEITDDEIDQRVTVRMERQKLLTGSDPLRLWAILDEAGLHRMTGGADVMRAQLEHLVELARDLPKLTIQVLPFSAGAHPGTSAFTVLEFREPLDLDAVYVENVAGELLIEDPKDVGPFKRAFQHLQGSALSERDSLALIAATAAAL
ncbi:helix-turn-helix domain-containing protein [Actinomadura gamaensis]|uniref:Helix-turn-helix domain-containing protein n=1 Tax=Actinomadura gamaensis TaxID=1763541 RepID=A0ABV9TP03_9ACTN